MTAAPDVHENEMPSSEVGDCLQRYHAGDLKATHDLYLHCAARFRKLARKMLRKFPVVQRWEQTDDVLQAALLRLQKALVATKVTRSNDLARLASTMIRRELIDLSRHYQGLRNMNGRHHTPHPHDALTHEPADSRDLETNLHLWEQFHQAIHTLTDEHQQLFDYLWYQGMSKSAVSKLNGESLSTVKRRWQEARLALIAIIGSDWPE